MSVIIIPPPFLEEQFLPPFLEEDIKNVSGISKGSQNPVLFNSGENFNDKIYFAHLESSVYYFIQSRQTSWRKVSHIKVIIDVT